MAIPPRLSIGLPASTARCNPAGSPVTLLGHSYEEYDLIISDNASTDETANTCGRYGKQESRTRFVRQPRNTDYALNHNFFSGHSPADLFKRASHDDLHAHALRRCVDAIDEYLHVVIARSLTVMIHSSAKVTESVEYPLATASLRPATLPECAGRRWGDEAGGVIRANILLRTSVHDSYNHTGTNNHPPRSVCATRSTRAPTSEPVLGAAEHKPARRVLVEGSKIDRKRLGTREIVMDEPMSSMEAAPEASAGGSARYYKRDFWSKENLKFAQPHFRLKKAARIVNAIARGKESNLLDVGCGPATLMRLLDENIHYYGVDIAIHDPAPNLLEIDFLKTPIKFGDRLFEIILAQGVFEYVGAFQSQKLDEIASLLAGNGKFLTSYWNFNHRDKQVYWPFSNIQSLNQFRESLARHFNIDRFFPVAHNWRQHEPDRRFMKAAQMHIDINIPFISPMLAVEYFFICSPYQKRV